MGRPRVDKHPVKTLVSDISDSAMEESKMMQTTSRNHNTEIHAANNQHRQKAGGSLLNVDVVGQTLKHTIKTGRRTYGAQRIIKMILGNSQWWNLYPCNV